MVDSIQDNKQTILEDETINPVIITDETVKALQSIDSKPLPPKSKTKHKTPKSKLRLKNIGDRKDTAILQSVKNTDGGNTVDSRIKKAGRPWGSTLQQAGEQAYKVLRPYVTRIYQAMLKGSRDGVTPTIQGKPVTAEQIKAARDLLPYVFPRLSQVDGSHNKANTINAVKVTVYTNENKPQNVPTIEQGCVITDDRGKGEVVESISVETVLNESGASDA